MSVLCRRADKEAKAPASETATTAKEATGKDAPEKPAASKNGNKAAVPASSKQDNAEETGDTAPM